MVDVWQTLMSISLGFLFGTFLLWVCSKTVDTPNADFKTALIYNGITTVALLVPVLTALFAEINESGFLGMMTLLLFIGYLVFSFWLLMRMYWISFFSALWIFIAMWGLQEGIEMLLGL